MPGEFPIVRIYDPEDDTELIFPANPTEISSAGSVETRSITLDEFGTLVRPLGRPPTTYTFAGTFFGAARAGQLGIPVVLWRPPVDLKWQLEMWHDRQPRRPPLQPLEFSITGLNLVDEIKPVFISRLGFTWRGGWGDLAYDLELTEYRAAMVGVDGGEDSGDALAAEEAIEGVAGEDEPALPAQYTVQPGDSLWAISQQLLGDGARWEEIYAIDANQETVGADPNLIYPGQVLLIPGGTGGAEDGGGNDMGDLALVELGEALAATDA